MGKFHLLTVAGTLARAAVTPICYKFTAIHSVVFSYVFQAQHRNVSSETPSLGQTCQKTRTGWGSWRWGQRTALLLSPATPLDPRWRSPYAWIRSWSYWYRWDVYTVYEEMFSQAVTPHERNFLFSFDFCCVCVQRHQMLLLKSQNFNLPSTCTHLPKLLCYHIQWVKVK